MTEDAMETEELREICERLFSIFDILNDEGEYLLTEFIHKMAEGKYLFNIVHDEVQVDAKRIDRIISDLPDFGFAFGFAIGQMLEAPYPEAQKDIEAIKKIIRENKLLPYLPRERRTP
jgi:hypothetical protein